MKIIRIWEFFFRDLFTLAAICKGLVRERSVCRFEPGVCRKSNLCRYRRPDNPAQSPTHHFPRLLTASSNAPSPGPARKWRVRSLAISKSDSLNRPGTSPEFRSCNPPALRSPNGFGFNFGQPLAASFPRFAWECIPGRFASVFCQGMADFRPTPSRTKLRNSLRGKKRGSSRICGERCLDGNQTILVWCVLASREWHIRGTATRAGSSGYLYRSPQIRDEPKMGGIIATKQGTFSPPQDGGMGKKPQTSFLLILF